MLSLSDAQRALARGNDAIYVNPAGLALTPTYAIEVGYFDDLMGSDRRFNASVVDGQAGPIAGGLAYTWTDRKSDDSEESLEGHRTEFAFATRLSESSAIGITARYLTFQRNENGEEVDDFKSFQLDAGFQWNIFGGLNVGVAGYNLTNSDRREVPISWGAGIGWGDEWFTLEADIRYNAQQGKPRYSLGGAILIGDYFIARAGGMYDHGPKSWAVSGGVGLNLGRFGIDAGFRQRITGEDLGDYGDDRVFGMSLQVRFF